MPKLRIAINGFGRIGRQVLKAMLERHPDKMEVVAINDLFDVTTNAHLLSYDTNYGKLPVAATVEDDIMVVGGGIIPEQDFQYLRDEGIAEIFTPGASLDQIVEWFRTHVSPRS